MLRRRARPWVIGLVAVGLVVAAAGMYWFQPWKLWVDETVQEDLNVAVAPQSPSAPTQPSPDPEGTTVPPTPSGPQTLATGTLISHEHETSGTVRILRAADGTLVLRLEDLDTSNGPDLHVWVTDAPVKPGKDGWSVFDDGAYVSAGKLKGNKGSQNYALPADFDLSRYSSVSIWCARFSVSFGAAELAKTPA
nr:DM13 domain-containing protein [Saccharothrix sp.]